MAGPVGDVIYTMKVLYSLVVISSPCFLMHHQISKVKIRHTTGDKWCTNHTAVFRSSVSRGDLAKI